MYKKFLSKLSGKEKKIVRASEAVDWDFEFKTSFIMSRLVNMYIPLSQENLLNRSVKPPTHLKRQRNIAWHNYKDLRQRNGRSSEISGPALIFYDSVNDQQARTQGGGAKWAIAPPLGLMLKKKSTVKIHKM